MARTVDGHLAITDWGSLLLRKANVPGRPIWLRTHRVYLPLFLRLAVLLDQVEPLRQRNTWSYNYRQARMGSGVSAHAGYAIDAWSDGIGSHTWPSRMTGAQAASISHVLEKFVTRDGRYVFLWGACNLAPGVIYRGETYTKPASHDPMHFAIAPGISWRDAQEVIARLGIKKDGTVKA